MNPSRTTRALLLLLSICSCHAAFAASPDSINIEADNMQMDLNSGTSTYTGNVRLTRTDMELAGDRIVIERDENNNRMIELTGSPATYKQTANGQTTHARSNVMTFSDDSNILTLQTGAVLDHDNQVVKSDFIRYHTVDRVLLAGGKESGDKKHRVNITLNPEQE